MVTILAYLLVLVLTGVAVEGDVASPRRFADCEERLFVHDEITIDVSSQDECIWHIETEDDRILVFTVEIHDGSNEHAPILLVENQPIFNISRKGVPRGIYTTQSTAVLRLKKTSSHFQLKIEKAVDCPFNLGAESQCGRIVDQVSCHCAVFTLRTRTDQYSFCFTKGMMLLSLESPEEELAVHNVWGYNFRFWTSLTDLYNENIWIWESTGTYLNQGYSNWGVGEPNNEDGDEHCMELVFSVWNDEYCGYQASAICESSP